LADPVAIIGVVSGATVAVTVPFISATLERRRLRWQTETARMDELRGFAGLAKFDEVMRDELRLQVRLPEGASVTEKHGAMRKLLQTAEWDARPSVSS
jgi:hypothetical protein